MAMPALAFSGQEPEESGGRPFIPPGWLVVYEVGIHTPDT
jgi:hypothetical protein